MRPVVNQGAQVNTKNKPSINTKSDEKNDIQSKDIKNNNDDYDDEEEPEYQKEECKRRLVHFEMPDNNDYGRGERNEKESSSSFSFLQTSFKDLTQDEQNNFFSYVWNE